MQGAGGILSKAFRMIIRDQTNAEHTGKTEKDPRDEHGFDPIRIPLPSQETTPAALTERDAFLE